MSKKIIAIIAGVLVLVVAIILIVVLTEKSPDTDTDTEEIKWTEVSEKIPTFTKTPSSFLTDTYNVQTVVINEVTANEYTAYKDEVVNKGYNLTEKPVSGKRIVYTTSTSDNSFERYNNAGDKIHIEYNSGNSQMTIVFTPANLGDGTKPAQNELKAQSAQSEYERSTVKYVKLHSDMDFMGVKTNSTTEYIYKSPTEYAGYINLDMSTQLDILNTSNTRCDFVVKDGKIIAKMLFSANDTSMKYYTNQDLPTGSIFLGTDDLGIDDVFSMFDEDIYEHYHGKGVGIINNKKLNFEYYVMGLSEFDINMEVRVFINDNKIYGIQALSSIVNYEVIVGTEDVPALWNIEQTCPTGYEEINLESFMENELFNELDNLIDNELDGIDDFNLPENFHISKDMIGHEDYIRFGDDWYYILNILGIRSGDKYIKNSDDTYTHYTLEYEMDEQTFELFYVWVADAIPLSIDEAYEAIYYDFYGILDDFSYSDKTPDMTTIEIGGVNIPCRFYQDADNVSYGEFDMSYDNKYYVDAIYDIILKTDMTIDDNNPIIISLSYVNYDLTELPELVEANYQVPVE